MSATIPSSHLLDRTLLYGGLENTVMVTPPGVEPHDGRLTRLPG
ncbi:MAG: hypothetical protein ACLQUY_24760 [Ktedonobacterales bacterium]